MTELINVHRISKSFNGTPALKDLTCSVHQGESICVLGPTGAGKSTLLRCLNLLELIDHGVIEYGGHRVIEAPLNGNGHAASGTVNGNGNGRAPIHKRRVLVNPDRFRRKFGFVFRTANLFPHRTILENMIEGPVYAQRRKRREALRDAREMLAAVRLADRERDYPDALSTEDRQRVALARALAMRPEIMLIDEITSDLYPPQIAALLEVMRDLRAIHNAAMVMTTHHLEFAAKTADRVAFMDQGRLLELGPPSLLQTPRTETMKRYLDVVRSAR